MNYFRTVLLCWLFLLFSGWLTISITTNSIALAVDRNSYFFLIKHSFGILASCLTAGIIIMIPWRLQWYIYFFGFLASLIATIITVFHGIAIHGSARWLSLGIATIQPSEFLKIFCVILISFLLERHQYHLTAIKSLLIIATIAFSTLGILLMQPDFGQAILVLLTVIILLGIARIPDSFLVILSGIASIVALLLIVIAPYRLKRFMIFLNPWNDPLGSGYQIIQSLQLICQGGYYGKGAFHGARYTAFPMIHTDFIIAALTHQWGMVGVTLIVSTYLILIQTLYAVSLRNDGARCFVTIAGSLLITIQTCFHLAVATGWAPPKGIGLPFISFGSSSLLAYGILMGLLLKISLQTQSVHPTAGHSSSVY